MSEPAIEHRTARVNGVDLHYATAGSGPLVVLLHGFPEFWYSWRHQLPALAAAEVDLVERDVPGTDGEDRQDGEAREEESSHRDEGAGQ